jgi:hypothetical protein
VNDNLAENKVVNGHAHKACQSQRLFAETARRILLQAIAIFVPDTIDYFPSLPTTIRRQTNEIAAGPHDNKLLKYGRSESNSSIGSVPNGVVHGLFAVSTLKRVLLAQR